MTTMIATNFDDGDDADGTPLLSATAGGGGGVDAPCADAAPSFDVTAAVGEEGMAMATTYDDDDVLHLCWATFGWIKATPQQPQRPHAIWMRWVSRRGTDRTTRRALVLFSVREF